MVMAGKYSPLERYLREVPGQEREVTLGFEQIEQILQSRLPSSAYEDERWWLHEKEANHVSTRAWTNAGWRIGQVDVDRKKVKLVRIE
jgi:hypothetical protein